MTETLGKGGKRPACQSAGCGQPAFYLCDYPVAQRGGLPHKSCSRALCKKHATSIAGVAHYCPPHDRMSRAPVVTPTERTPIPGFE